MEVVLWDVAVLHRVLRTNVLIEQNVERPEDGYYEQNTLSERNWGWLPCLDFQSHEEALLSGHDVTTRSGRGWIANFSRLIHHHKGRCCWLWFSRAFLPEWYHCFFLRASGWLEFNEYSVDWNFDAHSSSKRLFVRYYAQRLFTFFRNNISALLELVNSNSSAIRTLKFWPLYSRK